MPTACPTTCNKQLADRYAEIFKLFVKHRDKIDRVTFWGVHDGQSWLNYWPIAAEQLSAAVRPPAAAQAGVRGASSDGRESSR